jgi:ribosome-associated translation inhibitor RaiA
MRINVRPEGFELRPHLRRVVVSRLQSALGPFRSHIESVAVRLFISRDAGQLDTTICEVAVRLRPSGEIRAQAADVEMDGAIASASSDIRGAVEREVSTLRAVTGRRHAEGAGANPLELVVDDTRIPQFQRERPERPENELRPIRVREYWRPPAAGDDEAPRELESRAPWPRSPESNRTPDPRGRRTRRRRPRPVAGRYR